jgi:protein-disulfide isomerase
MTESPEPAGASAPVPADPSPILEPSPDPGAGELTHASEVGDAEAPAAGGDAPAVASEANATVEIDDLALPEEEPGADAVAAGRGPRRGPLLVAAGIVVALIVGGTATFGGLAAAGRLKPDPTPVPTAAPTPAPTPGLVTEGFSIGAADAPVTVEVWADYQCPFCRLETVAYGPAIIREFVMAHRARIVFRDFSFLGQESTDAAVAARCAGKQDPTAYWRYHDILFVVQQGENQGTFSHDNLVSLARIAGIDQAAFKTCLDDPAIAAEVAASTAEGRSLDVESTPTTRITGPGGTKVLKGFSPDWTVVRDAILAAEKPQASPSGSPAPSTSGGAASPGESAGPTGTPPASVQPISIPEETPIASESASPDPTPVPSPTP